MMETVIRIKKPVMEAISGLFSPGETAEVAFACGTMRLKQGTIERPEDRDYLVLTNRRLLHVKGAWFSDKKADTVTFIARKRISDPVARHFLLGCTVSLSVAADAYPHTKKQVTYANCGKPEGEALVRVLSDTMTTKQCPACGKPLDDRFAFCPYCKYSVRKVCRHCGRAQDEDWTNCPYCGGM